MELRVAIRPDAPRRRRVNAVGSGREREPLLAGGLPTQYVDVDPEETGEWLESSTPSSSTPGATGPATSCSRCCDGRREQQVGVPSLRSTDYINTIPPEHEPWFPGDERVERRIRAYSGGTPRSWCTGRSGPASAWAATSPPTRRPRRSTRSASTTSSAARTTPAAATRSYFQGHASPGIYARAFLEGRLSEHQLDGLPPGAVATPAAGCRRTRTRASCPATGSSPPSRWAWAR